MDGELPSLIGADCCEASMGTQFGLKGLLFSNDIQVVGIMRPILAAFGIESEVCADYASALNSISHGHLDIVLVDWDGPDPTRVVRNARTSSANRNSTIVAMVNRESEVHALLVGANFMISKPLDLDHARRCIRAAYGTMLQQRRRAARVSVDIPVVARVTDLGSFEGRVSDLSIGGLALELEEPVSLAREVSLLVKLPGTSSSIRVTGDIVNANVGKRLGLRFSVVPEEDLSLLEKWLAAELAKLEQAELPTANQGEGFPDEIRTGPLCSQSRRTVAARSARQI